MFNPLGMSSVHQFFINESRFKFVLDIIETSDVELNNGYGVFGEPDFSARDSLKLREKLR